MDSFSTWPACNETSAVARSPPSLEYSCLSSNAHLSVTCRRQADGPKFVGVDHVDRVVHHNAGHHQARSASQHIVLAGICPIVGIPYDDRLRSESAE